MALLVPYKATLGDLFRFLLVSRFSPTGLLLSFFRFFFWKNELRSEAERSRPQERRKALFNHSYDGNKSITSVTYNHLNKPEVIAIENQGTITYTYDALGSRLRKKVHTKATNSDDNIGNFVYRNDTLQYILNAEGRARPVVNDEHNTRFVYDYFMRDHLGNIRSTVTAEPMNQAYLASHEIAMAGTEQLIFDNIPNVRDVKPGGGGGDAMAIRLNGGESDKRIGTAIMLQAMPGDRFTVSADVFYEGSYQQSTEEVGSDAILQSLAAALTGGTTYSGVPVSELPANARIAGSLLNDPNLATTLSTLVDQTNNPDAPKAHLNILFFDQNFRLIPQVSSVTQVNPNLVGGNGWTVLTPTGSSGGSGGSPMCCTTPEPGYLVIYVDNQSIGKDVWFDNIMVGHYTGKVQEENHYYPYGLTLETDAQLNHKDQPYKYNGISLEKQLGLEMFETRYRSLGLDPQRGQFTQFDPKAELAFSISPYASMGNNPSNFADPFGDDDVNYNELPEKWHNFNTERDQVYEFEVQIFDKPARKKEADYGWLNVAQAAQRDIGRNDYNRWRSSNIEHVVMGQMAIGGRSTCGSCRHRSCLACLLARDHEYSEQPGNLDRGGRRSSCGCRRV
jgi:RHS repeat-associated protein